jgi:hypothetical protein
MRSMSMLFSVSLMVVFLASCAGTMQVVRAPLVSPVVVPAPDQFKMNAALKNGSGQNQTNWAFFVYTEYGAPGQFNNSSQKMFPVPAMAPNSSWAVLHDFDVTGGNAVPCLKNQCEGHSWLVLCPFAAPAWNQCSAPHVYDNPQLCVHVWWQPSGDLKDMQVKDCSSTMPSGQKSTGAATKSWSPAENLAIEVPSQKRL